MTKEERIKAAEAKEKTLTQFMDEVALIEIRSVSPNHNWTDWADWHRYLYPSTAQSFKAFREAAERYAKHIVEQAIANVKGAEAESKWVSVDDRLPKNFEQVLVWTTVCTTASYAYYAQNDWLYFTNSENFWLKTQPHIKVLFWQPLPSPPLNQQ